MTINLPDAPHVIYFYGPLDPSVDESDIIGWPSRGAQDPAFECIVVPDFYYYRMTGTMHEHMSNEVMIEKVGFLMSTYEEEYARDPEKIRNFAELCFNVAQSFDFRVTGNLKDRSKTVEAQLLYAVSALCHRIIKRGGSLIIYT